MNSFIALFSHKLIPLFWALFGFGALVTIHECGHFLFCKLFGIHTPTFSIGFGPELISKKIGSTHFRLALLPFGGYVEIAGHSEVAQGSQEFATMKGDASFNEKPYWQKFFVLMGGILFNLIFAYAIFTALFMSGDTSSKNGLEIAIVIPESPAEKAQLKQNDLILSINNTELLDSNGSIKNNAPQLFVEETRNNPLKEITLTIDRENKKETISVTLGSRVENGQEIGIFGAAFKRKKLSLSNAMIEGIHETSRWISTIAKSIISLFSKRSLDGAGGPIMILASSFSTAQQGLSSFLLFLAIISINLALINLLPFGIVDGGQLLLVTIEAIIRRPLPDVLKLIINLISLGCFALLFLYLTYKDIVALFGASLAQLYTKIKNFF